MIKDLGLLCCMLVVLLILFLGLIPLLTAMIAMALEPL